MALKQTVNEMNKLLAQITQDLQKAEGGNKAASQRVRTGTISLEKVAKKYRKESISEEKKTKGAGRKPAAKKPAAKAAAKKPAARPAARPAAKKPVARVAARAPAKKVSAKPAAAKKAVVRTKAAGKARMATARRG